MILIHLVAHVEVHFVALVERRRGIAGNGILTAMGDRNPEQRVVVAGALADAAGPADRTRLNHVVRFLDLVERVGAQRCAVQRALHLALLRVVARLQLRTQITDDAGRVAARADKAVVHRIAATTAAGQHQAEDQQPGEYAPIAL